MTNMKGEKNTILQSKSTGFGEKKSNVNRILDSKK